MKPIKETGFLNNELILWLSIMFTIIIASLFLNTKLSDITVAAKTLDDQLKIQIKKIEQSTDPKGIEDIIQKSNEKGKKELRKSIDSLSFNIQALIDVTYNLTERIKGIDDDFNLIKKGLPTVYTSANSAQPDNLEGKFEKNFSIIFDELKKIKIDVEGIINSRPHSIASPVQNGNNDKPLGNTNPNPSNEGNITSNPKFSDRLNFDDSKSEMMTDDATTNNNDFFETSNN